MHYLNLLAIYFYCSRLRTYLIVVTVKMIEGTENSGLIPAILVRLTIKSDYILRDNEGYQS